MKLLTGNANLPLAKAIASYLDMPLTNASVRRFADEEVFVEIHENVRGEDVFVLQSTGFPANDNLMELLICIDALKRASAKRITAVIPYFGYARQDRKPGPRTPISAKLVANLITVAGADRVLSVDLHAGQIQGFFDIPTDNLFAAPVMSEDIKARFPTDKLMIVSPDVGGVVRARALAKRLNNAPLAIVDKRREKAGESEVMNIIGDVSGRFCVLIDDIVDSAGTLCNAAQALRNAGAVDVVAYVTHGVLSGGAVARVGGSALSELVITDSIQPPESISEVKNIRALTIAPLLGEAIGAALRGETEARTVEVVFKDARTANDVWRTQPDQQLAYHGARVWARRYMPELMLGIYVPEEMPQAGPAAYEAPPAPKAEPARSAPRTTTGAYASPPSETPADAAPAQAQISDANLKRVQAAVTRLGLGTAGADQQGLRGEARQKFIRDQRLAYLAFCLGREVTSTLALTDEDAEVVVKMAEAGEIPPNA